MLPNKVDLARSRWPLSALSGRQALAQLELELELAVFVPQKSYDRPQPDTITVIARVSDRNGCRWKVDA